MKESRSCSVAGCERPHDSHGLCGMHVKRVKRHGDPGRGRPTRAEIIKRNVRIDEAGCWIWQGSLTRGGYGKYSSNQMAHRVSYETFVGLIGQGLHLDHLCRVRECVNPAHLEAVTPLVNAQRRDAELGIGGAKTHCPQGHPYDEENTARRNGRRYCRACQRERAKRYYYRRKSGSAK